MAYEGNHLAGDPVAQRVWRQRQIRIARAILAGATFGSLAAQEGVTDEHIRQIVRVACVHAIRLPPPAVPLPDHLSRTASIRNHKRFWRIRLAALERFWGLPKETATGGKAPRRQPSQERPAVTSVKQSAGRRSAPAGRPTRPSRKTRHGQ